MQAKKIVFTSDILRLSKDKSSRKLFAKNTYWLHHLLRRPIQQATQLPIELLEWEKGTDFNGEQVYDLLNLPMNIDGWVKFYYEEIIPNSVIDYFAPFLDQALVIGFEVPAYFMKICTALSLPCINIMWDPIRFMDDIFFSFNTNNEKIFEALLPYQLAPFLVYQSADLHKARFYRRQIEIEEAGALILGQTTGDRSLIEGDQLRKLTDFKPKLSDLSKRGKLWLRKHPFDSNFERNRDALEAVGLQVLERTYNIYDLLCAEQIKHVAAISSGTTLEAKFFEKSAETFIPSYYQYYKASNQYQENNCISVKDTFLEVNFWANVLKSVCSLTYKLDQQLPYKANRMRNANCSFWGYEEARNEQIIVKYDE
ncbi:MAG: hypothetical protein AAF849_17590 [Bacteroidota bacterium]